eukprot:9359004-Heterocapsa_arctica.AAC.1
MCIRDRAPTAARLTLRKQDWENADLITDQGHEIADRLCATPTAVQKVVYVIRGEGKAAFEEVAALQR